MLIMMKIKGDKRSQIKLTVDSQADGFFGVGVEVGVLCRAGVVASVHA